MKSIVVIALTGLCALAQAPAPKKPAAVVAARPSPGLLNPALAKATAPAIYTVVFNTSKGDVVIEVHRDWAPNGADRFYNLVKVGFFDGAPFFRVIPGFMAQFGIGATPAANKVWSSANIRDEPVKQSNLPGYLTFAQASIPNTRSTQLFINYKDNSRLDGQGFAPIGKVLDGMEVVEKFYTGYGGDLDQQALQEGGKAFYEKNFPQFDIIKTAKVLPQAPAAPAPAPAKK